MGLIYPPHRSLARRQAAKKVDLEKISAALVAINGAPAADPSDFNQHVDYFERKISVSQNNLLTVELRGKPGGGITIVIEGVVEPIAIEATKAVSCPTIGIGASAQCDGQVLVTEDMLGMFERVPRFVKRYEDIASVIGKAAAAYAEDVRNRSFPGEDQTYQPRD